MDKMLLVKLLGKVDAVRFEDVIYNLRDITYDIRVGLIQNMELFTDSYLKSIIKELNSQYKEINEIEENLSNTELLGYTNSKLYLSKYIVSIDENTKKLVESLYPFNKEEAIRYNNILCDEVLKY